MGACASSVHRDARERDNSHCPQLVRPSTTQRNRSETDLQGQVAASGVSGVSGAGFAAHHLGSSVVLTKVHRGHGLVHVPILDVVGRTCQALCIQCSTGSVVSCEVGVQAPNRPEPGPELVWFQDEAQRSAMLTATHCPDCNRCGTYMHPDVCAMCTDRFKTVVRECHTPTSVCCWYPAWTADCGLIANCLSASPVVVVTLSVGFLLLLRLPADESRCFAVG